MVSLPGSALSFSYQILQVEKLYLEELAVASLAGQPWKVDFPQECLRCGKPASWRQALATPPGLPVELAWRYERSENAVPLCKRCACWLERSRREDLRIDLAWGLWGQRLRRSGRGTRRVSRVVYWKVGTGKLTRSGPPSLAAMPGRRGVGPRRTPAHQAALARSLGVRYMRTS